MILLAAILIIQIFISYSDIFLNSRLTDLIPVQFFEITATTAYFLSFASIIYELMFKEDKTNYGKKNEKESERISYSFDELKSLIRIMGIVIVTRTLDIYKLKIEKSSDWKLNWLILGKELTAYIFACLMAILIGLSLSYLRSNNGLMIASITYMLLGIMTGLQYFAKLN